MLPLHVLIKGVDNYKNLMIIFYENIIHFFKYF